MAGCTRSRVACLSIADVRLVSVILLQATFRCDKCKRSANENIFRRGISSTSPVLICPDSFRAAFTRDARGQNWITANPATLRHVPTRAWFLLNPYGLSANNRTKIRNTRSSRIEEPWTNERKREACMLFIIYASAA